MKKYRLLFSLICGGILFLGSGFFMIRRFYYGEIPYLQEYAFPVMLGTILGGGIFLWRIREKTHHDILERLVEERTTELRIVNEQLEQEIVERQLAEEKRFKLEKRFWQKQKMESIGTLAGGIAHDFNNILQSIFISTQLAMDDLPVNHPVQEYVAQVFLMAKRGSELVQQIVSFSRQEVQKFEIIDIKSVIMETLKMLRSTLPRNIKIKSQLPESVSNIYGSVIQVQQILINLCNNASQAMQETGGELMIFLEEVVIKEEDALEFGIRKGHYLKLVVRDTGTGMSQETRRCIFDPFFTTKPQGEGAGLGLSVVHGLVKEHKGAIQVRSKFGQGSVFDIFLPIATEKMSGYKDDLFLLQKGTDHILLVEDEKMVARMLKRMLGKLGYRVTICTNGLEALKTFSAAPDRYDLILSDQKMPEMTGEQLAKNVFQLRPGFPFILMSGGHDNIDSDRISTLGIRKLLPKPFKKEQFSTIIREVLDSPKYLRKYSSSV